MRRSRVFAGSGSAPSSSRCSDAVVTSASLRKHDRRELLAQIQSIYASAETRGDIEDIELHHLDTSYKTPFLRKGLQVHMPYTAYAHWMLMQRLLIGAGVKRLQVNMDIDPMARAAFLCAFVEAVKRGDAHAFFVRHTNFQTVDQRRAILGDANAARAKFRRTLPPRIQKNRREVARLMMKERIAAAQTCGKWADKWVEHPMPTRSEPHKAVSWLTAKDSVDVDRMVDMYLDARIDHAFLRTRQLFNAFERPAGTSDSHNAFVSFAGVPSLDLGGAAFHSLLQQCPAPATKQATRYPLDDYLKGQCDRQTVVIGRGHGNSYHAFAAILVRSQGQRVAVDGRGGQHRIA